MKRYNKHQQQRMAELACKIVLELGFDAPSFHNKVYAALQIKNGMKPLNKSDEAIHKEFKRLGVIND